MSKRPTILLLHAGVYDNPEDKYVAHADYFLELSQLQKRRDVDVIEVDIRKNGFEGHFKNNNVCLVYTRQLRDWQAKAGQFFGPLAKLQDLADKNEAVMANGAKVWQWNFNKGDYLKELSQPGNGVRTVRTEIFHRADVLDPGKLDRILKQNPEGFVVKPGAGARAAGLHFILPKGRGFVVRSPREVSKGSFAEEQYDIEGFRDWFGEYVNKYENLGVLVQENVRHRQEVSVVFIQGQDPFAVLRTAGKDSWVAHEAFGGLNIPLSVVPPEVLKFAKHTIRAMPPEVCGAYFHRIDVLVSPDGLRLLEVEDGTPRLFYKETNRLNLYQATADRAVLQSKTKAGEATLQTIQIANSNTEPVPAAQCRELYSELRRKAVMARSGLSAASVLLVTRVAPARKSRRPRSGRVVSPSATPDDSGDQLACV